MDEEMIKTQENDFEEVQKVQEVQGEYEEVEIKQKEVRTDSYFDGGLLELIGWRLLAFLITGITLGFGAPWAKCMLYSWEYKHTVLNGKRLKFEGTGGDLFVHYFKWIFFTIITLGFYLIVLPVRKTKWYTYCYKFRNIISIYSLLQKKMDLQTFNNKQKEDCIHRKSIIFMGKISFMGIFNHNNIWYLWFMATNKNVKVAN